MATVNLKPIIDRIRKVVSDYGAGHVLIAGSLRPTLTRNTRTAPSFLIGTSSKPSKEYCASTLAQYLDMTDSSGRKSGKDYRRANRNVETCLLLLEAEELGIISSHILDLMISGDAPFSVSVLQKQIKDVMANRKKNSDV